MLMLLAQATPTPSPDEAIGWAERMSKGGVPVISLCVAIAAVVGLILLFKKLLEKSEEFKELEKHYRKTIEDKATVDKVDYEKRLLDAKTEAKERAVEIDRLMRERMQSEKESDATLAQAIRVLDANTKVLERVERHLDGKK
jgi:hypothetical protein